MGILNVTPDSFSDGGEFNTLDLALDQARRMVDEGAHIIDVGGESTRPGANPVSLDEELARVLPVVKTLAAEGLCVSVDTRHAQVARACLEAGASIVNDVSGFRDADMVKVVQENECGLVLMHMQGEPTTMQNSPSYSDVVSDVRDWLKEQAASLEAVGISRNRICLDPGPGFGKSLHHTIDIVRNFQEFARLGYPVMVAVSRKSYLGQVYGIERPADRDTVSASEACMAIELGASVVRTHNVTATLTSFEHLRPYAFIGLGCNVALVANPGEEREGKIAMLNQAIAQMCSLPDTQIVDISSFYESEPAYREDQDSFINAVVLIRTGLAPKELLKFLQAIENSLGRVRAEENGPRTCDLDILDYQLYVVESELLSLPHPGILERDFVVQPLLELRPQWLFANDKPLSEEQVTVGKAFRI